MKQRPRLKNANSFGTCCFLIGRSHYTSFLFKRQWFSDIFFVGIVQWGGEVDFVSFCEGWCCMSQRSWLGYVILQTWVFLCRIHWEKSQDVRETYGCKFKLDHLWLIATLLSYCRHSRYFINKKSNQPLIIIQVWQCLDTGYIKNCEAATHSEKIWTVMVFPNDLVWDSSFLLVFSLS